MSTSLTHRLGEYLAGPARAPLSAEVAHAARRCLVDWLAALVPGGAATPARALARALGDELGSGRALTYPARLEAPARTAALVNGTASHTVECDDIFRDAIYHPGCPVFSATLALAQSRGVDGAAFLAAAVAGYEVSTRIGVAAGAAHYEFWHNTATIGCFGSAAAGAHLLGLDAERSHHALALAATMAAGLQQAFRSDAMAKPLHGGRAAEAGVLAALAAEQGMTGAEAMLEGPRGFGAAMAGAPDWDDAFSDLGERFNVERMTFKAHACCGHSFAALDGVIALTASHGLVPDDIERIDVATYGKALEVVGSAQVESAYQARFSLPYCAASAVLHGPIALDAFTPERLGDPAIRALMARVSVTLDDEADRAFPRKRSAHVTILTRDGRRLTHHSPTRKGDPDSPLTDAELEAKFRALVHPVLGATAGDALLEQAWTVERMDNVTALGARGQP